MLFSLLELIRRINMKKIFVYLFVSVIFLTQIFGQTNWTKDPNNPVLTRGTNGEWDHGLVAVPYILFDGTTYHMWYAGYDGTTNTRIGYATSSDGINWTKYDDPATTASPYANSDPVLSQGPPGSWDDEVVYQPSVLFDGSTYHMWFSGHNGPTNRQIGYATFRYDSLDKIYG
jgi:hypothetical protein